MDIEKLVDFCFEEEMQKPNPTPAKDQTVLQNTLADVNNSAGAEVVKTENDKAVVRRPKVIQRVRRNTSGKKRRQSGSPLPLKKRRKMHHYPIALAINRQQVPNLGFTIEEEFRYLAHHLHLAMVLMIRYQVARPSGEK